MTQTTVSQERADTEHAHNTMPEPPDRALVALFDPTNATVPLVFERDDSHDDTRPQHDHWYAVEDCEGYRWQDVLAVAADEGREVVRLYRADDPTITVHNEAVAR